MIVTNWGERLLENVISELIVDKLLNDEAYPCFQICAIFVSKLSQNLDIVLWEGSLEHLFNMGLGAQLEAGIKALLDDVAGELELAETDEVLGDLAEDHFVLDLVI